MKARFVRRDGACEDRKVDDLLWRTGCPITIPFAEAKPFPFEPLPMPAVLEVETRTFFPRYFRGQMVNGSCASSRTIRMYVEDGALDSPIERAARGALELWLGAV